MKARAVIPARLHEFQEVSRMVRRPIGLHADFESAERGLERGSLAEFIGRSIEKRLDLFLLDRYFHDSDRLPQVPVVPERGLGYLFHHVHPLGNTAEGGELAVERGLWGDTDKELRAIAVRLAGN